LTFANFSSLANPLRSWTNLSVSSPGEATHVLLGDVTPRPRKLPDALKDVEILSHCTSVFSVSPSFPAMAWTKILYRYWNLKTAITP
jgi:hypothetical protein